MDSGNGDGQNGAPGRRGADGPRREVAKSDQVAGDADQSGSETDQTASDADQTASDADQLASMTDQVQADRDQHASDRDQSASDRDHTARNLSQPDEDYERSRLERLEGTLERDTSALGRIHTAIERDERATQRDELARLRDLAASARDQAAEARDFASSLEVDSTAGADIDPTAREHLLAAQERAMEFRRQAAADRDRAASDREEAARNRADAAADREQAALDRRHASIDELTGVYRRGIGIFSFERELSRARRVGTPTCLAFVDVDGLKALNDRDGHAAGDALLKDIGAALTEGLRPYDTVVRMGGDEFACVICDTDLDTSRERFDRISAAISADDPRRSISVGLIAVGSEETTAAALERADSAMRVAKGRRPDPGE